MILSRLFSRVLVWNKTHGENHLPKSNIPPGTMILEIRTYTASDFQFAYNIWCKSVMSHGEDFVANPFALTRCRIEPSGESSPHAHDDQEVFLIEQGTGVITINGEQNSVAAGDLIVIPSNYTHTLKNTSASEPLLFYSISWLGPKIPHVPKHCLVIAAPPTPNGPLHLGHLSGPYLAADVFRRYQRLQGVRAHYVLGTDDNQCYIENKARALSMGNHDVLARFKPLIKSALNQFNALPDEMIEPEHNHDYVSFIQQFFTTLVEKNVLVKRSAKAVFCNDAQKFIFGADVIGRCPHCKKTTGGHGCEACGHYNDCHDLLDVRSVYGSSPVSIKYVDRFYVSLDRHRAMLATMLDTCMMHPRLKQFYTDYLHKLPDVSASHVASWGIPVPHEASQIIYEWIEMAGAYTYYLTRAQKQFDCSWSGLQLVESFGFDNSFFYGLLVPALIHGYDESLPKPTAFLSNCFYLLDHEKFSTSRNHAIWAHEFLREQRADHVRFYLALTRGENTDTNFSRHDYETFIDRVIKGTWFTYLRNLNDGINNNQAASDETTLAGYQERFLEESKRLLWQIHESFGAKHFSLTKACRSIIRLQEDMHDFHERIRHNSHDYQTDLTLLVATTRAWAHALAPIMPTLSSALTKDQPPCIGLSITYHNTRLSPFCLSWFNPPHET